MSNYISVGITDTDLNYRADATQTTTASGKDPISMLFDFVDGIGLKIENALTDPRVKKFMIDANIKLKNEQIRVEQERREKEAKNSMLKWGAAATAIAALFILRKKK